MKTFLALTCAVFFASSAAHADITIGFVTSLSGPAASTGMPLVKGIEAALAYASVVGAEKLTIVRLDDASDPSSAARNARKLIEQEQVDVLMGSSTAPASIAIAAVANEMKVPLIALAPISTARRENSDTWAICVIQPPSLIVKTITDHMLATASKTLPL